MSASRVDEAQNIRVAVRGELDGSVLGSIGHAPDLLGGWLRRGAAPAHDPGTTTSTSSLADDVPQTSAPVGCAVGGVLDRGRLAELGVAGDDGAWPRGSLSVKTSAEHWLLAAARAASG